MLNCFVSLRTYPTEHTASVTKNNYYARLQTYVTLHFKPPFSFFRFYQNWNVSNMLVKVPNTFFPEIRPVGVRLLRADGETEKTKVIVVFHSCFATHALKWAQ